MAMKIVYVLLWFVLMICTDQKSQHEKITVPESTISRLFQTVLESQIRTDEIDVYGINHKGNYENLEIVQHVGDRPGTTRKWSIIKNQQILTFALYASGLLMEAYIYGKAPRPLDEQLISTVQFASRCRDISKPYNSSLLTFSPCMPIDTLNACLSIESGSFDVRNLDTSSEAHKLTQKTSRSNSVLGQMIDTLNEQMPSLVESGNDNGIADLLLKLIVPKMSKLIPDSDVVLLWIGLGSLLEMFKDEFPIVREAWIKSNLNTSSVFDALKKYTYRPFSPNPLVNTIDAANYFVVRHFLDRAKAAGEDVALVPVWFTNADEKPVPDRGNIYHKSINDIDCTTSANVIYGITLSVLSGLVNPEILEDPEVSQIYHNTSAFLSYLISSNFTNRVDLALPYYPSRHNLYFGVARTVSVMDFYKRKQNLPVKVMEVVFSSLQQALEGEVTRFLISDVKRENDGSLYFEDFLGNGDLTEDDQPIHRGEDRIFTTSMAANALMYTWLTFDSDFGKSYWKTGTPGIVKDIVDGCVLWLLKNTFDGGFEPWNVLLSMPSKGPNTLPFYYPSNFFLEIPQLYALQFVTNLRVAVGVQGYIHKSEYEAMINKTHFGKPTPTVFKGFNDPNSGDVLIFSSVPNTYASVLLTLSRYRQIDISDD